MIAQWRLGQIFQKPFGRTSASEHFKKNSNVRKVIIVRNKIYRSLSLSILVISFAKQLCGFVPFPRTCTNLFPNTIYCFTDDEAFSAKNELLHKQSGESEQRKGHNRFNRIKYIGFAIIWAFVAWKLLTIREKILPQHNIVVESNQTKCKFHFDKCLIV